MKTRWIVALCCIGGMVALLVQRRLISQLRLQIGDLRTERTTQSTEQTFAVRVPEAHGAELEQLLKDEGELLRLRNEARQLREQIAALRVGRDAAVQQSVPQSTAQRDEPARRLGSAASAGDYAALDRLSALSLAAHERLKTNAEGDVFAEVRAAFDTLGSEAIKGNATALEALMRASRKDTLQGFAVEALGKAAGQGIEPALEPLLDPDRYFLTRSSVVGALKPAADSGNVRAIQALATVAADPNAQALWFMTAQGLETAARAGNGTAIDSLVALVRSDNQAVRRTAFVALESSAIQHARAADALRSLNAN